MSGTILVFGFVTGYHDIVQEGYAQASNENNIAVGIAGKEVGGVNGVGVVYIYDGTSGHLLRIINSPESRFSGQFGEFITFSDNKLAVGASGVESDDHKIGAVYVFDATTGSLLYTIKNPETNPYVSESGSPVQYLSSSFGSSIAFVGNNIVVTAPGKIGVGAVYVFDGATGNLVQTINDPIPKELDGFGNSMHSFKDKIIVGIPYREVDNFENAGAVSVFDLTTGYDVLTINNPEPTSLGIFGSSISTSGDKIIVGSPRKHIDGRENSGAVYIFDGTNGSLLYTINNPDPNDDDYFGHSLTSFDDKIAVGARGAGYLMAGIVYTFDVNTGRLLEKIENPEVLSHGGFGSSLAASENKLVVGAPGRFIPPNEDSGAVYILDGRSGSLLQKINDTSSTVTDIFGSSVTFVGMVIPDDNIQTGIEPNAGNMTNSNNIPIQAENTNGLEIINLQVQPSTIKVGDTFTINATLVNNSVNPIFAEHGACEASFFVTFDNHVTANVKNKVCHLELIAQKLNPGEKITGTSPSSSNLTYRAIAAGTANATVTFSYEVWDQTTQSSIRKVISKSVLFTIYDSNAGTKTVKDSSLSPLKQFKSGIAAEEVICKENLKLIFKVRDGSPACVLPLTYYKLAERGWAKFTGGSWSPDRTVYPDPFAHSNTYKIGSFEISATIINGSINSIHRTVDSNSIFVELSPFNEGNLIIKIPKTMLKAIDNDYSKFSFFVLSNGEETPYEQIDPETIKINFQNYTKKIEIIGASRLN